MNIYILSLVIVVIIGGIIAGIVIGAKEATDKVEKVKLVCYTAPTCPNSQRLAPELKKFKKWTKNKDKYKAVNVKCEKNPNECREQNIKRLPTLKLFVNGGHKKTWVGWCNSITLKEIVKNYKKL